CARLVGGGAWGIIEYW
nr:immunoglobulin heavy chain junction region [Macaca mulatta]MOW94453.1 immunoglobulin heavy chain junction region [Macaca mulatta]MOW95039.1 immunoglobulin heavy chain junction region [Macaca mulatta]MOW95083.1 immunoglobulin heavy chain junction region [Macaca mulatta]MOW95292.1 immunoglobulin heavy chain junction region [Macaca mulatta]